MFKAVENMEPVEVKRDPSQSEGPGKSQFTAALKYLIQKKKRVKNTEIAIPKLCLSAKCLSTAS